VSHERTKAFGLLTGRRIRQLIRDDNRTLEEWNDEDSLKGDERDRLGLKEARFQSLLAQVLRENNFGVVVESYLSKDSKKKFYSSCDLYAWDRKNAKGYWVEVKRQDLTPNNNSGGKELILQVFSDIGKVKAGKGNTKPGNLNTEYAVIWIGFFGSSMYLKECFRDPPMRFNFQIGSITPSKLKQIWRGKGSSSVAKSRTKRLLGNSRGGSVSMALLDLVHWIRIKGGGSKVIEVRDPQNLNKEERVRYGIFCGILS
jgi:hypothetical protein